MSKRFIYLVSALVIMGAVLACNLPIPGLSGGNAGTVDNLWSDVPQFPGASKAQIDLPLPAQLLIRTMTENRVSFIAFATTKTPDEVSKFYTPDLMKKTGWSADSPCQSSSDPSTGSGAFCAFTKSSGGKDEALMLAVFVDDSTKQTQIFYIRFDTTNLTTPTPKR